MIGAGGQPQPGAGLVQQLQIGFAQGAVPVHFAGVEVGVDLAGAGQLPFAGGDDPAAHLGAGFAVAARAGAQRFAVDARHFQEHVDAVQQWLGDAAAVFALLFRGAVVAPGAGIHGGDELETGGEFGLVSGPGDGDMAVFQGLAQDFQHFAVKLGQFVQKQHAVVRQGNLSGPGRGAAADQGHAGGGVVRTADDAPPPAGRVQALVADGGDGRRFQGFGLGHGRQDVGQAGGEHGFAGARGTAHEHGVAAGGGDFQGALAVVLAADIGQVRRVRFVRLSAFGGGRLRRQGGVAGDFAADLQQAGCRQDARVFDQGGLGGVFPGHDQGPARVTGLERGGEHAAHRT